MFVYLLLVTFLRGVFMTIGKAFNVAINTITLSSFIQGLPTDAEKLFTHAVSVPFTLAVGLAGSVVFAEVASAANAVFTLHKNGGASLGTVDFTIATSLATFTFATATSFVAGDRLQLVNQGTADATLADISITLQGGL